MTRVPPPETIAGYFRDACHGELTALKPGNVHIHSQGHGMTVATFEAAAAAAAPHIADRNLTVGMRILRATQASFGITGVNANLGIILLCVPLAKAAEEVRLDAGLRQQLASLLSRLDEDDADLAFEAIRLANPAGLGSVEKGDVTLANPRMTLIEAMHLARDRDRIANAYVTAYADIFDFALPVLAEARAQCERPDLAVTTLHMALLAEYPDSHISRKYGPAAASTVRERARELRPLWSPVATPNSFNKLMEFDATLKQQKLNPGTTADFVVASLLTAKLVRQKQR